MPVHLYKKLIRANDGPWTQPSSYSTEELGSIVNPYARVVFSLPGIIAGVVQYFESSTVFVRKYTFDTVDHALAFYKLVNDLSVPEVKAMRDLARRYADAAGTVYTTEWKLTQDATP